MHASSRGARKHPRDAGDVIMRRRPRAYEMTRRAMVAVGSAAIVSAAAAAQPAPASAPVPRFDPRAFRAGGVSNPYFPLEPGAVYVYTIREGGRTSIDSIVVTGETKVIGGVAAVVVHDRVRRGKVIVEDTRDWYAQDTAGTVWYLGEATTSYEGKTPSTAGSWEHGVDGARAGIIMQARPAPGAPYRQEYRKGVAEDMGRVVSAGDIATVPAGHYTDCITTEDWSPLEPETMERKTYCPGVGLVRETTTKGSREVTELVSLRRSQPR